MQGCAAALQPPAVESEDVGVLGVGRGELADVGVAVVVDDGMLRRVGEVQPAPAKTVGVTEEDLYEGLGAAGGEHLVAPPVVGERGGVVPPPVHEVRERHSRRMQGGQPVPQVP